MTYRKPKFRFNSNKVGKTIADSAKFITDQHSESNSATRRGVRLMSAQQNINFTLANSKLIVRRMRSANKAHARLVATGKEDGWIRTVYEWVAPKPRKKHLRVQLMEAGPVNTNHKIKPGRPFDSQRLNKQ